MLPLAHCLARKRIVHPVQMAFSHAGFSLAVYKYYIKPSHKMCDFCGGLTSCLPTSESFSEQQRFQFGHPQEQFRDRTGPTGTWINRPRSNCTRPNSYQKPFFESCMPSMVAHCTPFDPGSKIYKVIQHFNFSSICVQHPLGVFVDSKIPLSQSVLLAALAGHG